MGLLEACGPQERADLVRECQQQAIGYSESAFATALLELFGAKLVFTDGEIYSTNPDDIEVTE